MGDGGFSCHCWYLRSLGLLHPPSPPVPTSAFPFSPDFTTSGVDPSTPAGTLTFPFYVIGASITGPTPLITGASALSGFLGETDYLALKVDSR